MYVVLKSLSHGSEFLYHISYKYNIASNTVEHLYLAGVFIWCYGKIKDREI